MAWIGLGGANRLSGQAPLVGDNQILAAVPDGEGGAPRGNREFFEIEKRGGIVFAEGPDYRLKLDVYRPTSGGPYPGILLLHGGAWATGSKFNWQFHARRLARRGFVVVAINYRLAPRYKFPAQLEDAQWAVRWMRAHATEYSLNPRQVAAYGYSAGGHLALLLATSSPCGDETQLPERLRNESPLVDCAAAGGAPADFAWLAPDSWALVYWLGRTRRVAPELYRAAEPLAQLTNRVPEAVFLYHAANDNLVPSSSARRFATAAEGLGAKVRWVTLPKKGHWQGFLYLPITNEIVNFFHDHWKSPPKLRGPGR